MNATLETPPRQIAADAPKGIVLFDGDCAFCRRSVAILARLDWFRRMDFQNFRDKEHLPESFVSLDESRMNEEMHVLTPNRRELFAGFAAFRWIAARLPLGWMAVPLMYVPGVPRLGQRIYLWIAKNRMKLVPCRDGQCEIPMRPKKK